VFVFVFVFVPVPPTVPVDGVVVVVGVDVTAPPDTLPHDGESPPLHVIGTVASTPLRYTQGAIADEAQRPSPCDTAMP